MNQFQKFARPSLRAGAMGRAAEIPPLRRPAAFNSDQMATHSRGRGSPRQGRRCAFPYARPFIRQGWSYATTREFSEADCLVKAGVDRRAATLQAANQSQASGAVQGLTDLPEPIHSSSLSSAVRHARTKAREAMNAVQENPKAGSTHDC